MNEIKIIQNLMDSGLAYVGETGVFLDIHKNKSKNEPLWLFRPTKGPYPVVYRSPWGGGSLCDDWEWEKLSKIIVKN